MSFRDKIFDLIFEKDDEAPEIPGAVSQAKQDTREIREELQPDDDLPGDSFHWKDRDIVNRWVFGSIPEQLRENIAGFELDEQPNAFIGFCYVEHFFGIRCKVFALCDMNPEHDLTVCVNLHEALQYWTLLYELLPGTILLDDEEVRSLGLPLLPKMMEDYGLDEYKELRGREDLDPFRAPGYFDDVEVILGETTFAVPPEKVWVRLDGITENENTFRGELLNQPYGDFGVNKGDPIDVLFVKGNDGSFLVSIVKPEEQITGPAAGTEKVFCFIPCSRSKSPSGSRYGIPSRWVDDLEASTRAKFLKGREIMKGSIEDSLLTDALALYTGNFYRQLDKDYLAEKISKGSLRIFIISAGYGVVDAFEPIHEYDALMSGNTARIWKSIDLAEVISEILIKNKPEKVFGFFAGEPEWSGGSTKYRHFFSQGAQRALSQGLNVREAGCFYRAEGRGVASILSLLGMCFMEAAESEFSGDFVERVRDEGFRDERYPAALVNYERYFSGKK